jgi:hypothetical protein
MDYTAPKIVVKLLYVFFFLMELWFSVYWQSEQNLPETIIRLMALWPPAAEKLGFND